MHITFDKQGFSVNGRDDYMVSGEFHYFRVPKADWQRRMELFREAGGNVLATYVPWIIHEPTEGDIRFGDVPARDLAAFLETAKEAGLAVVLRPGPYQYSELVNDGLPDWLLTDYPEILARNPEGNPFHHSSVSYLHPTFLTKARRYFQAFADAVRPYMGDPVVMLQVDNEATGIHSWFGSIDCHPETMGFGQPDGRYPRFLRKRYGTIDAVNRAYGTEFSDFTEVGAPGGLSRQNPAHCRRRGDYYDFYYETVAEYLTLLRDWMIEDGLSAAFCHNAAGPHMVSLFRETADAMGDGFLLGVDHYYTLGQAWAQNSPTPQHAIRAFASLERLRLLGMPPSVLEMPGGSPTDTPPILPEDLLAWYRTNLAFGMKGVNYYVFTGGPNFPDTGATCDIYDYNALIRADGTKNATYDAAADFGAFVRARPWLQRASRRVSVQVGFDWKQSRARDYDWQSVPSSAAALHDFLEKGVLHTLFCSRYAPALCALDGDPDPTLPLIVPTASCMAEAVQEKLVRFVKDGGKLLLLGALPEYDEQYEPCTVLRKFLGNPVTEKPTASHQPIRLADGPNVYSLQRLQTVPQLPAGTVSIAEDTASGCSIGLRKECGGTLLWLGFQWHMGSFTEAVMLENLLSDLGAQPAAESSNRNLFTTLLEGPDGEKFLSVINLFSGAQSTEITLFDGGIPRPLGTFSLKPMEVLQIEL